MTTTAAPSTGGLFGTTTGAAASGSTATPTTAAQSFEAKATQPPPQSRLKNKSMEEIINRWTSDLEKYKAEFVKQAEEVKKWDAVLITNGDKLVNLLSETTEAEKTQARMDTVLQQLENEQEELGTALDYYESQIKDFFEAQFGSADGMQPADQEREKTYSLAETLNETLINMEGDLGEMIKAINKAGATINKTSNADDPVSPPPVKKTY
jgi:nuclear pore complex protein Nup62